MRPPPLKAVVSTPVILTTLNSSYFHTAFGLRYLYANLGPLQSSARVLEFTTQQNTRDIAEEILKHSPEILGMSVYIWNAPQSFELVSLLKSIEPNLKVILGGPEVSYEFENQPIFQLADHLICGEGDLAFRKACETLLRGDPLPKVLPAETPEITSLSLPYSLYTDEDIRHRVIYVEASRGCPYKCEFCLSSLDKSVRAFPLDIFLGEIEQLVKRGARTFKFVDRTFNLNYKTSEAILRFFLERVSLGLFIHFELVPDRLPNELKTLIRQFPKGSLQFEVGIQTWNEEVAKTISRRQDYQKTVENLEFLKKETGVHLHTDLIAGLPGEDLESFARGFDKLSALEPHEIQVGILKRLRGTPIIRHDSMFDMVYQTTPPYPILKTGQMGFEQIQAMQRFAKFWDLYGNSGNFKRTLKFLKALAKARNPSSLFWEFWEFSEFLNTRHPQRHSLALLTLVESLWVYLTEVRGLEKEAVRESLTQDYCKDVSRDIPRFLRVNPDALLAKSLNASSLNRGPVPKRQYLHLGTH